MLSCKEASRLNSERFDRQLTLRERALLFLHLGVCDACTKVLAQLKFMREAMEHYRAGPPAKRDSDQERL